MVLLLPEPTIKQDTAVLAKPPLTLIALLTGKG